MVRVWRGTSFPTPHVASFVRRCVLANPDNAHRSPSSFLMAKTWRQEVSELAGPPQESNESLLSAARFQQQLQFFDSGLAETTIEESLDACLEVMKRAQEHAKELDKDTSFDRMDKLRITEIAAKIAKQQVGITKEYLGLKEKFGKLGEGWYKAAAARWTKKHLRRHVKDPDIVNRVMNDMARDIEREETTMAHILADQLRGEK